MTLFPDVVHLQEFLTHLVLTRDAIGVWRQSVHESGPSLAQLTMDWQTQTGARITHAESPSVRMYQETPDRRLVFMATTILFTMPVVAAHDPQAPAE